jgi:DNA-binding NarL/FixJ family response regulator
MLGLPPDQTESDTLALLSTLVDCSLIVRLPDPQHEPRYGMLETIRQFGLWKLEAHGERDDTFRALSCGHTALVDQARKEIGGPNQKPWIDRLEAERSNERAICEWAIQANEPDIVLRLSTGLWPFWVQRGNLAEGRDLLQRALASPGLADEALRANSVFRIGNLTFELHEYDAARKAFAECLEIWERFDDRDGIACAQNGLGLIDRELGAYEKASTRFQIASEIWQALDDASGVAVAQLSLATVALAAGNAKGATTYLAHALTLLRELNDVDRAAYAIFRLGQAACLDSRLERAQELFRESLEVFTRIGDRVGEASVLYGMACRALLSADQPDALRLFHNALSLRHALASRNGIIEPVEGIAAIAATRGNAVDAARLLAATAAYRTRIGTVPPYAERRRIEAAWAAVHDRLTPSVVHEARRAGETMSLDEMAIDALRLLKPPAPAAPVDVLKNLSAREREVFVLLSEYLTDREIAERLFLSHRTVERHVGSILEKLDVKNRREAAALGSLRRTS